MRRSEFDAAVAKHGSKVLTLAVYLLGQREEAEDVAQEVLIRLWKKGDEVSPGRLGAWLVRVTRNACIDRFRGRRAEIDRRTSTEQPILAAIAERRPDPESLARASELGVHIRQALDEVGEPQRSVVILREIQGLSYQEIADALNMTVGNVRVTLHRGRRRLRNELREVQGHVAAC
jgi:RNA polymerase sigma factor (sigma-70 family)